MEDFLFSQREPLHGRPDLVEHHLKNGRIHSHCESKIGNLTLTLA